MKEMRFNFGQVKRALLYGGWEPITAHDVYAALRLKPDYIINVTTAQDTIINREAINGDHENVRGLAWDDDDFCGKTVEVAEQRGYKYFLAGSPTLIWDGKVQIDEAGYDDSFLKHEKTNRSGMGISDNELILCFEDSAVTIDDFAQKMADAGCKYAINIDGGGSTAIFKKGHGKAVALNKKDDKKLCSTWLGIYLRKERKKRGAVHE